MIRHVTAPEPVPTGPPGGEPSVAPRPAGVPSAPRAEAVVDLDAVRHNVALLSGTAARSGAATMVVVKADGYGHGAAEVGRAALESGAGWLGVATLEEATALRAAGITAPVLSWLHVPDEDFAPAVAAGVDLSVSSREHLAAVLGAGRRTGKVVRLHLKADTGLGRNGAPPAEWPGLVDDAAAAAAVGEAEIVAVWSHLAQADEPAHPMQDVQAAALDAAWRHVRERGFAPLRHLANSAATMTRPDLHLDLVRPGIAAYGLDPIAQPAQSPLRPAMTLRARVALVKQVPAGHGVSYGHEWTSPAPATLALIPAGYADGVPRRLNDGGRMRVRIDDAIRPVVGRVCMDQVVVDCGDVAVRAGDTVELFGTGERGGPTAREWADELGTIHYEVVTGMRGRIRRTVHGDSNGAGTPAGHVGSGRW
ncbi:alanine racemase [Pseudonocardia sp. KRD291]|uniref:alanine racemase n=1 Tax=Pseudonocardia sp. KRD291 TaxID=2792007 RepID=UPI001C49F2B3|nr:alanine racemase [Pseudonocardia sp. KRD291]MBW0106660.1 alanine racemase [Pseudonocardia sp. KRD291]